MDGSVQQQVRQGLLHQNKVHAHEGQPSRHLDRNLVATHIPFDLFECGLNQVSHIAPVQLGPNVARFEPCHVQQVAHQTVQSL